MALKLSTAKTLIKHSGTYCPTLKYFVLWVSFKGHINLCPKENTCRLIFRVSGLAGFLE